MGLKADAPRISLMLALKDCFKGRYSLSRELGLGEGVIRRLYRELRREGLITVVRGGARLTPLGVMRLEEELRRCGIIAIKLFKPDSVMGEGLMGVVAALAASIRNVVDARDCVVRAGARSALVIKRGSGRFYLPLVEDYDLERGMPRLYAALSSMPSRSRSFVAAFAETLTPCVEGVIRVAALARNSLV